MKMTCSVCQNYKFPKKANWGLSLKFKDTKYIYSKQLFVKIYTQMQFYSTRGNIDTRRNIERITVQIIIIKIWSCFFFVFCFFFSRFCGFQYGEKI